MESEKDVNLEVDPATVAAIIATCIQLADFCANHKSEIKALINKGYRSAKKIVDYLKKKYHIK